MYRVSSRGRWETPERTMKTLTEHPGLPEPQQNPISILRSVVLQICGSKTTSWQKHCCKKPKKKTWKCRKKRHQLLSSIHSRSCEECSWFKTPAWSLNTFITPVSKHWGYVSGGSTGNPGHSGKESCGPTRLQSRSEPPEPQSATWTTWYRADDAWSSCRLVV